MKSSHRPHGSLRATVFGLTRAVHRPAGRKAIGPVLLAAALLSWAPVAAVAKKKPKPTKTVTGQVFDASNLPVAGADVELTDLTTKKKLDMYTQENGSYEFGGLSFNHNYQVQAHYRGLTSSARIVSSWDPRAEMVLNLYLNPAKE